MPTRSDRTVRPSGSFTETFDAVGGDLVPEEESIDNRRDGSVGAGSATGEDAAEKRTASSILEEKAALKERPKRRAATPGVVATRKLSSSTSFSGEAKEGFGSSEDAESTPSLQQQKAALKERSERAATPGAVAARKWPLLSTSCSEEEISRTKVSYLSPILQEKAKHKTMRTERAAKKAGAKAVASNSLDREQRRNRIEAIASMDAFAPPSPIQASMTLSQSHEDTEIFARSESTSRLSSSSFKSGDDNLKSWTESSDVASIPPPPMPRDEATSSELVEGSDVIVVEVGWDETPSSDRGEQDTDNLFHAWRGTVDDDSLTVNAHDKDNHICARNSVPFDAVVADNVTSRMKREHEAMRRHIVNNAPVIEGRVEMLPNNRKSTGNRVCWRRWKALTCIALALIIIAAVIIGVIFKPGSSGNSAPSSVPTVAPTGASATTRFAVIKSILEPLTAEGVFDDPSSPQYEALYWLSVLDGRNVDVSDETSLVQRYALATLYFATGGNKSWIKDFKFLSSEHECFWNYQDRNSTTKGIFCSKNESNTIDILDISENNVSGSLPEDIVLLSKLEYLNMTRNRLEGHMNSLGNVSSLRVLDLSFNMLNSTIPSTLGELENLQHLQLNENSLVGAVPAALGRLTDLEELYLHVNALEGSIPSSLGRLTKLQQLWLGYNRLSSSIPSSLNNLSELRYLFLNNANLNCSLPFTVDSFPHLLSLKVARNALTGAIPESVYTYQNLTHVDLDYNIFTGTLSNSIGNLTNIGIFGANGNELNGTIPSTITKLQNMHWLALASNHFTGTLNPEMGQLKRLEKLYLAENRFVGSVPETFGNLVNLQDFQLYMNDFTGTLPASLGQLTNLWSFGLDNNSFVGDASFMCANNSFKLFMADCSEVSSECFTACCDDETYGKGPVYGCFPA